MSSIPVLFPPSCLLCRSSASQAQPSTSSIKPSVTASPGTSSSPSSGILDGPISSISDTSALSFGTTPTNWSSSSETEFHRVSSTPSASQGTSRYVLLISCLPYPRYPCSQRILAYFLIRRPLHLPHRQTIFNFPTHEFRSPPSPHKPWFLMYLRQQFLHRLARPARTRRLRW